MELPNQIQVCLLLLLSDKHQKSSLVIIGYNSVVTMHYCMLRCPNAIFWELHICTFLFLQHIKNTMTEGQLGQNSATTACNEK